jgi:hypothetical protein
LPEQRQAVPQIMHGTARKHYKALMAFASASISLNYYNLYN